MIIDNGGKVLSAYGLLTSPSNRVFVSGAGSIWSNQNDFSVGGYGAGNSLVISNGGRVIINGSSAVGGSTGEGNRVRIVNGGVWQNSGLIIGNQGSSNSVVIVDGSVFATNVLIGVTSTTCDNFLQLDSGNVIVTNASGNATLEMRRGKFVLNGGTLRVDRFVMTNSCAQFIRTGGTLIYEVTVLDPNTDADGDGIPNDWEQAHGLDPLNAADANVDSDGDGFTNLQEYLAGTDPEDNASALRIASIVQVETNVLVTWTMGSGKTNALQAAAGASYTTNFVDLFIVTNTAGSVTNYLDVGGATNLPARYYRVRLVP